MRYFDHLGPEQRDFLSRGYLRPGFTPEQQFKEICKAAGDRSADPSLGYRLYKYLSQGWLSLASPIISNFGHGNNLPASCNYSYVMDTMSSIMGTATEMAFLAKNGAGTAVDFSNIRPLGASISGGGMSGGVLPWIEMYESIIKQVSQGGTRKGFMTAYLKASHSDIMDFLDIGMPSHNIQHITTAVVIPKGFMQEMLNGNSRNREVWAKILKRRSEIGFPYILFEENAYKNIPEIYVDKARNLNSSNICSEVIGDVRPDVETFVCVLSSLNLKYYDEWKDTMFVQDVREFLDIVTQEYIDKAQGRERFEKALKYITEHRSVGIGVLGFHTYLQSKGIPFGSLESYRVNKEIFKNIREQADIANRRLATQYGEPKYCKGYGIRGDLSIALAPTKSTSFIMGGVSEGIQPIKSNYTENFLAKVQSTYKNPELLKVLQGYNKDTKVVWDSIRDNNGSVQHLDFLTDHEKDVFKTFVEISQADIISLAAERQKYVDQSQSLNLMIPPDTPPKEVHKLMVTAYESGIKTLYYNYGINSSQLYSKELLECTVCEA